MKLKTLLSGLVAIISFNTNATFIPLDYNSVFTDNGNKVTEVRTFNDNSVQTWEWLDLTVTNGIRYHDLVTDLEDDGLLNNSGYVSPTANIGAKLDVQGLVEADQYGWITVTHNGVINLFNAYFGTTLYEHQSHNFGANIGIMEDFISMFGDTYHEGLQDLGVSLGLNSSGKNSAYTRGSTTQHHTLYAYSAFAHDGEFHDRTVDNINDYLDPMSSLLHVDEDYFDAGTFLVRERLVEAIEEVPEPTSIALFALALSALVVRRCRLI